MSSVSCNVLSVTGKPSSSSSASIVIESGALPDDFASTLIVASSALSVFVGMRSARSIAFSVTVLSGSGVDACSPNFGYSTAVNSTTSPFCALTVKMNPDSPVTSPEAQTRIEISSPTMIDVSPPSTSSHRVGSAVGRHAGSAVCVGIAVGAAVGVGVFVGFGVGEAAGVNVAVGIGVIRGFCSGADGVCVRTGAGVLDESVVDVPLGSGRTDGTDSSGFEGTGVRIAA